MALNKQAVNINFSQGLDTKTDPKQVQIGKFLNLRNSVFDKQGALAKRNGYPLLSTLPNADQTTLTTLNDNLIATGSNLYAYSKDTDKWLNQGIVQPIQLDTLAAIRASANQIAPDIAVAANGLVCLTYMEDGDSYYQILDGDTGQQIVGRIALPSTANNPRAFLLGRYFIVSYTVTISLVTHLQYVAIPTANPSSPNSPQDISTQVASINAGYDAIVANNNLYFGWSGSGTTVKIAYLASNLIVSAPVSMASHSADLVSMQADISNTTNLIWISFWDNGSQDGYAAAYTSTLTSVLAPAQIITNTSLNAITSVSSSGILTVMYEVNNTYGSGPNSAVKTDYIERLTIDSLGVITGPDTILRSVGLASKAFLDASGVMYALAVYGEINQPTYFLIDSDGNIYMRMAYSNGGGYETTQVLPNVPNVDDQYSVPYLIKDFLAPVNKGTNLPSGQPVNGIYTQTGLNIAKFTINALNQQSSEIADTLHLTGGQLWMYDGIKPVESGFHVWPENVAVTTATGSGSIAAGTYYYQFTYEWTDNRGNLHRSAPSIPVVITTSTSSSTNTLYVPTLRLTYKTGDNPVRIVGYRWSVAQQVYYQFTSVQTPVINDPTVDLVVITDDLADSSILGQTLLYTTGGVIENIAPPASADSTLFKNRLFLIDAENKNLLWYSKQVIQNVPVEMSDLLTLYVAPTSGSQGSTGPMAALSAMDDKLIIFKENAIYYMTGIGPDNTGANNDFTDPVFITSAVGCANPNSIVLMPQGLMFQSDKGIWLLGRDLSTNYIGAPVEAFNNETVKSAQAIPGTNQVRFILGNNVTLMYDYYFNQWGTFNNISAISSTLYQGMHTYLSSFGKVYKETQGVYTDGSAPVLMSFTTSWLNVAGLQGYERFYFANLLGTYFTPFKLDVQLAYDYNPSAYHNILVQPTNYTAAYGDQAQWGWENPNWGGPGNILSARLFPNKQKCQTFQVTVNEVYDSSLGVAPGQGLTLSGLALIVGVKRGWRTQSAAKSYG